MWRIHSVITEQQSDSYPNSQVPVDRAQLRHITQILSAQEGLNTALLGTFLFLAEIKLNWLGGWAGSLAWFTGLALFLAAWRKWVPRHYQKRFGRVEGQEVSAKHFAILLLVLITLFFVGHPAGHPFDPLLSNFTTRVHLAISDPQHQINLSPPFLWLTLFLIGLRWSLPRMEGEGCFHLLGLLAFTSIALFPILHPGAEKLEAWRILNAGGFGLSLIAIGFYDHIVLVRALPKTISEGNDE